MENKLILTQDGSHTLLSEKFGVHYHSLFGAIQESEHVFIRNGLLALKEKPEIKILEMGFGTGLNAWLTWLKTTEQPVFYTTFETNPITEAEARNLNYPALTGERNFICLHQVDWNSWEKLSHNFHLRKINQPIETSKLPPGFDLIYHDAFDPVVQPELWNLDLLRNYYDALNPGGILVTYCAKGNVKRALREAGFVVERLKGPPGKRHMLRARKGDNES